MINLKQNCNDDQMKKLIKMGLNASYGKFAAKPSTEEFLLCENNTKLFVTLRKYADKTTNIRLLDDDTAEVTIKKPADNRRNPKNYLPITIYTNAYGRMFLRRKIENLKQQNTKIRLLHCNTDSAIFVAPTSELSKLQVDISSNVGDWKNPLSSHPQEEFGLQNLNTEIVAFFSLGGHVSIKFFM